MRLASLIGHCREALVLILERSHVPADALIAPYFKDRRYLGSRDRGFIAETVYGTLREFLRYRFVLYGRHDARDLNPVREAPGALAAFLLEAERYDKKEIAEGARIPAGEIERILRLLDKWKSVPPSMPEPERSAAEFALPVWLAGELLRQYGDDARPLMGALKEPAPITLRANTLLTTRDRLADSLREHGVESVPGRFAPDALVLKRRMNANALPEFKQGLFELQDEGSQLLSVLLDPHPNWKVFDACAGAGGKTLHLAAIMKGRGGVTAHDVNERRLMNFRPRLRRSGAQNVRLMKPDEFRRARPDLMGTFDAVLIDAPCTGTGTLRRNPGMVLTLEREMLERVVRLQREILENYAPLVKPGGVLFYATCSLLDQENREQVAGFLERNSGWEIAPLNVPDTAGTPEGFFRMTPHQHGTDGFFGAAFRRVAGG